MFIVGAVNHGRRAAAPTSRNCWKTPRLSGIWTRTTLKYIRSSKR